MGEESFGTKGLVRQCLYVVFLVPQRHLLAFIETVLRVADYRRQGSVNSHNLLDG